jgi:5-formyltetrahydrofolate cyclo-ligase
MDSVARRKEKLRKHFLKIRTEMDPVLREKYSREIFKHLTAWQLFRSADTVHCFMTIEENGEIITIPIIEWLQSNGKRVVIPKSNQKTKDLKHFVYQNKDQLERNKWGIPEPVEGEEVSVNDPDMILVPVVAADLEKNRLGYGLGFYDRFLAQTEAVKTGLLFENCLSKMPLPVEKFDVQLDYLVTEKGIY